jgi:hypothetical protein
VGVLLLFAATSCSLDSLLQGSVSTATPLPFQLDQLLLDESVFPVGWVAIESPSLALEGRGQVDDLKMEFRCIADSSLFFHEIYRYTDERAAGRRFRRHSDFSSTDRITEWETPSELKYESQVAERFCFACADFRGYPTERYTACQAMGQYHEFISSFSISYVRENMANCMSWSDLERILRAVDERMMRHLGMAGE